MSRELSNLPEVEEIILSPHSENLHEDHVTLQVMERALRRVETKLFPRSLLGLCKQPTMVSSVFAFILFFTPLASYATQTDPLISSYLYNTAESSPTTRVDGLSGSFSHSVPLTLPPGRNGLHPSLSLNYSSQPTNSLSSFGYGWELSIPYIQRINKTGTGNLYTTDYFYSSLSGELATTSDATVFYPRSEDGSYLEYTFASSTNQWTVVDKTGTIYKFGHASTSQEVDPSDSTHVYKWMLEEVRDTNNNYISYEYFKDGNVLYPDTITYTGHDSTPGVFTVDFARELRPDIATSTASTFEMTSKYRINEISASINGTWARKYELDYTAGDNGSRSLLSTVTESGQAFDTGSSVVSTLPSTIFSYASSTPSWATTTDFALPAAFRETYVDTGLRLLDYNSDALVDAVIAKEGTTTQMYANDGDSWVLDTGSSFPTAFVNSDGEDLGVRLVDVNGDSRVDVVKSIAGNTQTWLNTATGFATTSDYASPVVLAGSYGVDRGVRFADINGDGLPDVLFAMWYPESGFGDQGVYLNTGTGWESSGWTLPIVFYNFWTSGLTQTLEVQVLDINNDGLADILADDDNQHGTPGVYINSGSGWNLSTSWTLPVDLGNDGDDRGVRVFDVNGDQLPDIVDGSEGNRDVYLNTGSGWSLDSEWVSPVIFRSTNGYAAQMADVDGDGLVDIVQRNNSVHNRYYNLAQPADLLTNIRESTGVTRSVSYESSADAINNPELPFSLQTVTAVGVHNGLDTTATTTYEYENGEFYFSSALDRLYAGFGVMTATDPLGNVSKTYYHQGNQTASTTGEVDDSRAKIGRVYRSEVYDDDDNLYTLQIQGWDSFTRATSTDFVYVATSTTLIYDGDGDHKDTAESFTYDTDYGSLTQSIAWGEVNGSTDGSFTDTGSDKRTTAITYVASSTSNLILPSQETVTDQSAVKIRETRNYYDTLGLGSITKGNLTKQEFWTDASNYIDTEKTYNALGLVTQEKDPRDKITNYVYDAYNLYPATTTNALSQITERYFDYSSGKANYVIDVNDRVTQVLSDPFDRPIEEKQPDLITPSTLVTRTAYQYVDTSMPRRVQKTEYLSAATSTDSYLFTNGLGKKVEERVEVEGDNTYIVRDYSYDLRGNLASETLPFFASSTAYSATSSPATSALVTEYEYDTLSRITAINNVLGETTNEYDQWRVTTTDALNNEKEYLKDAYGNLTEVVEHNDSSEYTTEYEYDGNNKLTKLTDAENNVRNFSYDGVGRRLSAQDLHDSGDGTYGTWTYIYDASGNLTSQTDPKSQTVVFTYDDINRPLTENYTGAGGTEVEYGYDTCTEGVGRLCTATSTDAVTSYTYNALGGVASENKTIDGNSYTTGYSYDRKGNPTLITYPDTSEVAYGYNNAGLVELVNYKEVGGTFAPVVTNYDYAPTGSVAFKEFANGVTSTYTYDSSKLYRLTNILTVKGESEESLMGGGGGEEFSFFPSQSYAFSASSPITYASAQMFSQLVLDPDDFAEEISPEPDVPQIEEPIVENAEAIASSTEEVFIIETSASSTPAAEVITTETSTTTNVGDDVATSTESVLTDDGGVDVQSVPALEVSTSTPEVLEEEQVPQFLLADIPGRKIAVGGNVVTEEKGIDERGDTIYEAQIFSQNVRYTDSLTGETKNIDVRLNETSDAWEMTTAPYGARLAKSSSDRTVTFRSGNLELYFDSALTEAKSARLFDKGGTEFVVYPDALGADVDLEIHLDNEALWKEAVIQSKEALSSLTSVNGYVEVPFTLTASDDIDLLSEEGESLSGSGSLISGGRMTVINNFDAPVYFRAPVATDASGRGTSIQIRYEKNGKEIKLTKLIPIEWLDEAEYPVRTDTVVTYNSDSGGDGTVKKEGDYSWDTQHDATSGVVVSNGLQTFVQKWTSHNRFYRSSVPFDTSGLPDNAAISQVLLKVWAATTNTSDDDGNDFIRVVQTSIASSTDLVSEDYDQIGAVNNPTAGANDIDVSGISTNAFTTFELNSTGLGWVDKTGFTKLGLREGHDAVDDPVASNSASGATFYSVDHYESGKRPQLVITYTTPAPPTAPSGLLAEGQTNPTNITDYSPEFSAIYEDTDDGDIALSYQIQVATSTSYWGEPIWDSTKTLLNTSITEGNRSEDISYGGTQLTASTTYYWRMRFWDQADATGDWSTTTASFLIADTGALVSPVFKSISTGSWVSGSSIVINKPAGLEVGDLMVAITAIDNNGASTPTGWIKLEGASQEIYRVGLEAYAKIADATDVATSTFTMNGGLYTSTGAILRISDASINDITTSIQFIDDWGTATKSFDPGVIPVRDDSLLVSSFHSARNYTYSGYGIDVDNPTWTERVDLGTSAEGGHSFALATAIRSTSTTTDSYYVTRSNTGGRAYGMLISIAGNAEPSAPSSLETEEQSNPTNVTDETPEFSAVYNDLDDGDLATHYQLQVATSTDFSAPYWDSGKSALTATTTEGSRTPEISYAGTDLVRETTYYWRIKLWDDDGMEGVWSSSANFYYAISAESNVLQDITYTYDAVGNITKITDVSGTQAAKVVLFGYDDLYRLTTASTTAASSTPFAHTYSYTSIGNLSSSTPSGAYTYGETGYTNPHAPTNVGGTSLGYDNNGNLTSYGTDLYAWDYRNRMASSTVGGLGTTYGYDHSMQRVSKTINSVTTVYPNQYFEKEGTATTTKYIWAGGELIATVNGNGVSTSTEYIHSDHLGSTNVTTNDQGEVQSVLDYLPFGSERISTGDELPGRGYIAQFTDREQDLSYLQNRYYSSDRGQFISQDPVFWEIGQTPDGKAVLQNPQAQNSYSYAQNNPIVNKDPTGRIADTILDVAFIGYDLYKLGDAAIAGDWQGVKNEAGNLALDGAATFIPGVTGLGSVKRVAQGGEFVARGAQITLSEKRYQHIINRHTLGGSEFVAGKTSYFNDGVDIKSLVNKSSKQTGVVNSDGYIERVVNAGKNVGVDRVTGKQTSTYSVITDKKGNVITAHPGKPGKPRQR